MALSEKYLCYAYGETELPDAEIVSTRAEVEEFIRAEVAADDKEILALYMKDFDEHDWNEGPFKTEFEIGGLSIEKVFSK